MATLISRQAQIPGLEGRNDKLMNNRLFSLINNENVDIAYTVIEKKKTI